MGVVCPGNWERKRGPPRGLTDRPGGAKDAWRLLLPAPSGRERGERAGARGLSPGRGWVGHARGAWGAADEGRRLARGYSFRIKRIPPRASQERLSGGMASSQAPYPSPLLLLFPPQNFAVGALYFPPDNPLETTKGEARGPLLWKPLRGLRRICYGERWDERRGTGGRYGEGWGMGEKFCIRFVIYFLGWLWYAGGTREPCYVDRPSGGLPGLNQEAEQ